jgi:hypothetical protein
VLLCKLEKIYPPGFFQSNAAHDFAPPVWGTNGGACTCPLVLFNWNGTKGHSNVV